MAEPVETKYALLSRLIQGMLCGESDETQMRQLNRMLSEDPKCLEYYIEYTTVWAILDEMDASQETDFRPEHAVSMMGDLAAYEKMAPAVEPMPQERPRELIRRVVYQKMTHKITPFQVASFLLSAAAVVLLALFIRFAPVRSGTEVATLTQSIGAKWIDKGMTTVVGKRLMNTDPPFILGEGLAELSFDSGVNVIVQSPAEFQIITADQLKLSYGRIFVAVEGGAGEFIVQTPQSKIIDVGTQFGVYTDMRGQTELHVVEGKTILIAGSGSESSRVTNVTAGQAQSVDADGTLKEIPFQKDQFVRGFVSASGFRWKERPVIDLAAIVAGDSGMKTPEGIYALNPLTGMRSDFFIGKTRSSNRTYNRMAGPSLVDGVFVPYGGQMTVSSAGDVFVCPETEQYFTHDVTVLYGEKAERKEGKDHIIAGGDNYRIATHPHLLLHSNTGITFDFAAIRESVGPNGGKPVTFRAVAGMRRIDPENTAYVNFYVLADGKVQFEKNALSSQDGLLELNLPIIPGARFITLVVTDCMEKDLIPGQACSNDFLYLIDPRLVW